MSGFCDCSLSTQSRWTRGSHEYHTTTPPTTSLGHLVLSSHADALQLSPQVDIRSTSFLLCPTATRNHRASPSLSTLPLTTHSFTPAAWKS